MRSSSKRPGYVYGFYAGGIMVASAALEYFVQDNTYQRTFSLALFIIVVSGLKLWWAKRNPK